MLVFEGLFDTYTYIRCMYTLDLSFSMYFNVNNPIDSNVSVGPQLVSKSVNTRIRTVQPIWPNYVALCVKFTIHK